MRKVVAAISLVLAPWFAPVQAGELDEAPDYQQVAQQTPWDWSDEKASLDYCVRKFLHDYNVEVGPVKGEEPVTVRILSGEREVYTFRAPVGTTLACSGRTLFLATFPPRSSNCEVEAIDLDTGKHLWKQQVQGLGPIPGLRCRHRLNIDTDGRAVILRGNEPTGRYVEILDSRTGKRTAHRIFRDE
jgi:hypothetical protein